MEGPSVMAGGLNPDDLWRSFSNTKYSVILWFYENMCISQNLKMQGPLQQLLHIFQQRLRVRICSTKTLHWEKDDHAEQSSSVKRKISIPMNSYIFLIIWFGIETVLKIFRTHYKLCTILICFWCAILYSQTSVSLGQVNRKFCSLHYIWVVSQACYISHILKLGIGRKRIWCLGSFLVFDCYRTMSKNPSF